MPTWEPTTNTDTANGQVIQTLSWECATSSLVGSACDMYMHPLASGSTGRALSLAQL